MKFDTRKPFQISALLLLPLLLTHCTPAPEANAPKSIRTFQVRGIVTDIPDQRDRLVVRHEEIPGYMDAMTMSFQLRRTNLIDEVRVGDEISFRLLVGPEESWVEGIRRTGKAMTAAAEDGSETVPDPAPANTHPLMSQPFTNQFNRAVRLSDFRGQALAITFFFTRCPIPDYCPRLTKNFQAASRKLAAMSGPTNWHLLSISIDPRNDTPEVLRAYGEGFGYDAAHWSFLTGTEQVIGDLARQSGLEFTWENGLPNHNFRTLIVDPFGRLRMSFPMGGDLSDAIVAELREASAATTERSP